ncbi:DUF2764 family protein [Paludibacter sp. 221]|uniref:DUF2764 family protein n=1 Tax=Paludibacter sp. 221 TaxID=2302939 RepID=UPI0013D20EFB|nr:DUF2764 family protein [Paludibacter sp. 221]NDV46694.1 DUF2764 family protein [Paludibacter sp. 221]
MRYYYLIAGLPDIQLEDPKGVSTMDALKTDLEEQLSDEDMKLLNLIYAKYDNRNLLFYLQNKDAELNPLGALKADDWKELVSLMEESEQPKDSRLLPYIPDYYQAYKDENVSFNGISDEDYLAGLYYEYAMQNNNEFLHNWFEFNLNINNLLAAIACRKYGFEPQQYIIGNNEIAQILRKSNARDFGLTGIFDELDAVVKISEESNLLSREKQIDELKWNWLEEHTFFDYFTIERVLSFVLKCELINRWKPLTQEKGTKIFRELLDSLKEDVRFDE